VALNAGLVFRADRVSLGAPKQGNHARMFSGRSIETGAHQPAPKKKKKKTNTSEEGNSDIQGKTRKDLLIAIKP